MTDPGEILLFQTEDGQTSIDVRLVGETVWLSAGQIADLFQRDKSTISRHIQNVYEKGELKQGGTAAFFAVVQKEGDREVTVWPQGQVAQRKADVAIAKNYLGRDRSVGRRSSGAKWRADFGADRAKEYPEGISRRGPHRKMTPNRSDATRTSERSRPSPEELRQLNLIVAAYLDFAELQARNQRPMYMRDWIKKLDQFIQLSEREILTHAGKITAEAARALAEQEYEKYRRTLAAQPLPVEVHFDEAVKKAKQLGQAKKKNGNKAEDGK